MLRDDPLPRTIEAHYYKSSFGKKVIIINAHYRQLNIWKSEIALRIKQQLIKFISCYHSYFINFNLIYTYFILPKQHVYFTDNLH